MINKIKKILNKNACIKCDYYRSRDTVCQLLKHMPCGYHWEVNWLDRHFCRPHKRGKEE